MNGRRRLPISLACLLPAVVAIAAAAVPQDEVVPIPVQVRERAKTSPPSSVESLMHAKLEHPRAILEGIVMHDFEQITEAAEAMKLMSVKPPKDWDREADDEVYEHFRMEFLRNAARLEQEARNRHLAGAAWFQQNLNATCIACHDYIRDEGLDGER